MVEIGECIVLNDREYLCFNKAELDGEEYIYLTTVEEPTSVFFARQAIKDGQLQIQIIGNRDQKLKLATILQEKAAAAAAESLNN